MLRVCRISEFFFCYSERTILCRKSRRVYVTGFNAFDLDSTITNEKKAHTYGITFPIIDAAKNRPIAPQAW